MRASRSIHIRISSRNAKLSASFAEEILPRLSQGRGREAIPAVVWNDGRCPGIEITEKITEWSFADAIPRTRDLLERGVNTILLSEEFVEWNASTEVINDDLYAWEDFLLHNCVDVIGIETYESPEEISNAEQNFSRSDRWPVIRLDDLVNFAVEETTDMSILAPYGCNPYVFIDPALTEDSVEGHTVRILAGAQTWIFPRFQQVFGEFEFPYSQAGTRRGTPQNINAGPMPVTIEC